MRTLFIGPLTGGLVALVTIACSGGTGPQEPVATTATALEKGSAIIPRLPATPTVTAVTVPKNGDVNPYGVAFVPKGFPRSGLLRPGDIIVSNFNDSTGAQGTGTTIVRINGTVAPDVFFQDDAAAGLSTALGVLKRGFVLVGNVPSTTGTGQCVPGPNGEMGNVGAGALRVIDVHGKTVRTLEDATFLDGVWDMTVDDRGSRPVVFVSNVLSGTVSRLVLRIDDQDKDDDDPRIEVESKTQIASGYLHRCDQFAFVVGPTGLALDRERDVLYVAATGDNAIFAVRDASDTRLDRGMGQLIASGGQLRGPLGMVRANNGDLISAQGDIGSNVDPTQPSELVELTAHGTFVDQFSVDTGTGGAFGIALEERGKHFRLAAVDDNAPSLLIFDVE
jgi:hypothetical protein